MSGRAQRMGGQEEWEGRRNGKEGGMAGREERKAELTKLEKLKELKHTATTLCHDSLETKPGNKIMW